MTPDKVYPITSELEIVTTECGVSLLVGAGVSVVGMPPCGVEVIFVRLPLANAVAVAMMR